MPSELKLLKLDFKVDQVWDGRPLNALLPHFRAPNGSGGTTALQFALLAMGSPSAKLVGEAQASVQAVRLTVQVASGRWTLTRDCTQQQVTFVCEATGETTELPVDSRGGLQSAGAFFVDLLGLPLVETEKGTVTVDAVLRLLTLTQERAVTTRVGGAVGSQDNEVTWELAAGLLDAPAVSAKNRYRAASTARTKASNALEKVREARRTHGQASAGELDERERRHRADHDRAQTDIKDATAVLEEATQLHHKRQQAAEKAFHTYREAGRAAHLAAGALGPLYEQLGVARTRLEEAENRLIESARCTACDQELPDRPACRMCGQHDADAADRRRQRLEEVEAARQLCQRAQDALKDAHGAEREAVARREEAEEEWKRLGQEAEAHRATQVTAAQHALDQARTRQREADLQLQAVAELRKELWEVLEKERHLDHCTAQEEEACEAWQKAEGEAAERRSKRAKELTDIFAPLLLGMSPRFLDARIEEKSFRPIVNTVQSQHLAVYAGQHILVHLAWHLTLFTAAHTLPGFRLPAFLWLDSPLDSLGAGEEGEAQAAAALRAIQEVSAAAEDKGQIILKTPHALPEGQPGLRTQVLDTRDRFIPHLQPGHS